MGKSFSLGISLATVAKQKRFSTFKYSCNQIGHIWIIQDNLLISMTVTLITLAIPPSPGKVTYSQSVSIWEEGHHCVYHNMFLTNTNILFMVASNQAKEIKYFCPFSCFQWHPGMTQSIIIHAYKAITAPSFRLDLLKPPFLPGPILNLYYLCSDSQLVTKCIPGASTFYPTLLTS